MCFGLSIAIVVASAYIGDGLFVKTVANDLLISFEDIVLSNGRFLACPMAVLLHSHSLGLDKPISM